MFTLLTILTLIAPIALAALAYRVFVRVMRSRYGGGAEPATLARHAEASSAAARSEAERERRVA